MKPEALNKVLHSRIRKHQAEIERLERVNQELIEVNGQLQQSIGNLEQAKFKVCKVILTGPRNMANQQLMIARVDEDPAGVVVWVTK